MPATSDTQRAYPAIALRYINQADRRRKITAGRQTIPELIEVVRKISLKARNELAVNTSSSLVACDLFIGFPYFPFRNVKRLCSIHEGSFHRWLTLGES